MYQCRGKEQGETWIQKGELREVSSQEFLPGVSALSYF